MKPIFAACALVVALAFPAPDARAEAAAPVAPAGRYTLDKSHASLVFRLSHLGFSFYTARFQRFDATLDIDPEKPEAARVEATIDPASLDLPTPPEGFKAALLGPDWLDAGTYPTIAFRSTKVTPTGETTATIAGELTLHGATKPVTLDATFNGGYAGHPMDPNARIGFSATGTFKRSDFGIAYGIPAPGTTMGVGDEIDVAIEAEFTGPPLAAGTAAE